MAGSACRCWALGGYRGTCAVVGDYPQYCCGWSCGHVGLVQQLGASFVAVTELGNYSWKLLAHALQASVHHRLSEACCPPSQPVTLADILRRLCYSYSSRVFGA